MTRIIILSLVFIGACVQKPDPADIVYVNGGIYTVNTDRGWAEAAAVRGHDIIAVGNNSDVDSYIGSETRVIDLTGRMAMPGFQDTHAHPLEGGYLLQSCDIWTDVNTGAAMFARLKQCVADSDEDWIIGYGMDLSLFGPDGPDNSHLDEISTQHFFFIEASDGHTVLVNDRVLELAGVTAETEDPEYGVIERRPDSMEPNGTLREAAYELASAFRPERTVENSQITLLNAVQAMNAVGITSTADVWVGELELQLWKSLDDAGELTLRVKNSIIDEGVFEKHSGEDFARVLSTRNEYASDLIDNDGVKFMVDGVLEGETAALLEPYIGLGHQGNLNHEAGELDARVQRYDAMGLDIHMHTLGDLATKAGLDAIEKAKMANANNPTSTDTRHTLSHLALIGEDDLPRFGELGVSASFTGVWAFPDDWVVEMNLPVIGEDRVNRMYPIRPVIDAGGIAVGGSDWIYGALPPLFSIETLITRQDFSNSGGAVLNASNAVDLQTAIEMYTVNAAWAMHQDDITGSIEIGKRADIIVLEQNLFEVRPDQLSDVVIISTLFDGQIVYETPQ